MNTTWLIYIISLLIIQGLMYFNYRLFLRRETWFRFNRLYLLSIPILSLILPMIEIPFASPVSLTVHQLEEVLITPKENPGTTSSRIAWQPIAWNIYFTGVIAALGLFLYRLKKLLDFIDSQNPIEKTPIYTLYHTGGVFPTSSFFHYIFWDETMNMNEEAQEKIITHECYHIRQKHSWDILFMELFQIAFWFNPVIYLIRKELLLVHEYLADRSTVAKYSRKAYANLILQEAVGVQLPFIHPFFESPALSRIKMLQTLPNLKRAWKHYASVIILFLSIVQIVCVVPLSQQVLDTLPGGTTAKTVLGVNDFIAVEQAPKPLNLGEIRSKIGYPQVARDADIEGDVVVRILVDKEGSYVRHVVLKDVHPTLQEAVEVEISNIRFAPAVNQGEEVAFWVNVPFAFRLIQ